MKVVVSSLVTLLSLVASASAASVGVDGVIGSEWTGATEKTVTQDPSAATSNFASPITSNAIGYNVYSRSDADYAYFALQSTSATTHGINDFANLYFATGYPSDDTTYFVVGIAGDGSFYGVNPATSMTYSLAGTGVDVAKGGSTVIEIAIPFAALAAVPQFNFSGSIALFMSQSFGYSVAGGSGFGSDFLGVDSVAAPLPAVAGMGTSLLSLLALRRRR